MTEEKKLVYEKTFAIAWGDMDAVGHVNNTRYFDYFQEARVEWLLTMDLDMSHGTGPVIIQTDCTFLKPIVYPATLTLHVKMHRIGRSSFCLDYDLYQNGTLMSEGGSKIVWIDYRLAKSVPLPEVIHTTYSQAT